MSSCFAANVSHQMNSHDLRRKRAIDMMKRASSDEIPRWGDLPPSAAMLEHEK
jgi:hypothetical protein